MSHTNASPHSRQRGALRLLIDPHFGPLVFGRLVSSVGVWAYTAVVAVGVFEITNSTTSVSLVSVSLFGPQIALAVWSGGKADKGNRLTQLAVGRAIVAIGAGGLGVWMGAREFAELSSPLPVYLSSVLLGAGFAIGGPAMHALVPSMVSRDEVTDAVALLNSPMMVARAIGPAMGILISLSFSPRYAMAMAALGNTVFCLVVVLLGRHILSSVKIGTVGHHEGALRATLETLRQKPRLAILLLGVAVVGYGSDPAVTLTPLIASESGLSEGFAGLLLSCFGLGALLGVVVNPQFTRRLNSSGSPTAGLFILAAGFSLAAGAPPIFTAVLGMILAGLGMTVTLSSLSSGILLGVDEDYRGRIMGAWSIAFIGSRPLSAYLNGAVADVYGASVALLLAAIVMSVMAGVLLYIGVGSAEAARQ